MLNINQDNNEQSGEFTAKLNGENAGLLQYQWKDADTFNIAHTEVEKQFSGKGIGKNLVEAAVDFARKENKKIVATCAYAKSVLERDSSAEDVFIK